MEPELTPLTEATPPGPPSTELADDATATRATTKASEPATLGELLELAYALQGKQVNIKASVAEALATEPADQDAALQQRAAELGSQDRLLSVPPRLLASAERIDLEPRLLRRVRQVVGAACAACPGLQGVPVERFFIEGWDLDPLLSALDDHFRSARAADLGLEDDPNSRDVLRDNTFTAAILAFAMANRLPELDTVTLLDRHVWQPQLSRSKNRPSVGQLAESRSPETLGLVGSSYQGRLERMQRQIDAKENELRSTREAHDALQRELEASARTNTELRGQLAILEQEVAGVRNELERARSSAHADQTHAVNDYERLRTSVVRSLRDRIGMLEDALHATRNERYMVVEDFLDRVIDGLRRELHELQD